MDVPQEPAAAIAVMAFFIGSGLFFLAGSGERWVVCSPAAGWMGNINRLVLFTLQCRD